MALGINGTWRIKMNGLSQTIAFLLFVFSSHLNATVIFNDRVNDASNLLPNPTVLSSIGVGSFDIVGHLNSADRDFFTINLVGSQLSSIELTEWSAPHSLNWWVGVNDTSSYILNQSFIGEDILAALQIDTSESTYTFGTQAGNIILDYAFRITTTAVPLPAGIYLFLSGLVGLGLARR